MSKSIPGSSHRVAPLPVGTSAMGGLSLNVNTQHLDTGKRGYWPSVKAVGIVMKQVCHILWKQFTNVNSKFCVQMVTKLLNS